MLQEVAISTHILMNESIWVVFYLKQVKSYPSSICKSHNLVSHFIQRPSLSLYYLILVINPTRLLKHDSEHIDSVEEHRAKKDQQVVHKMYNCWYTFLDLCLFSDSAFARHCLRLKIPWYCLAFTNTGSSTVSDGRGTPACWIPINWRCTWWNYTTLFFKTRTKV